MHLPRKQASREGHAGSNPAVSANQGVLTERPKVPAWKAEGRSDAARRFDSCTPRQMGAFYGSLSRVGLAATVLKAEGQRELVCGFEAHGSRQDCLSPV